MKTSVMRLLWLGPHTFLGIPAELLSKFIME